MVLFFPRVLFCLSRLPFGLLAAKCARRSGIKWLEERNLETVKRSNSMCPTAWLGPASRAIGPRWRGRSLVGDGTSRLLSSGPMVKANARSLKLGVSEMSTRSRANFANSGFTLMEVMAAIFLTSIVTAFAVSFYINISDSNTRATQMMRQGIRATAILNRLSRDLDGTSLVVKAEEEDPLDHPWYFVAESDMAFDGSDRIRFISRNHTPGASSTHTSDLIQIAYQVVPEEDGSLSLYRWTLPSLPESYEPSFPSVEEEGNFIVAEGIESLFLQFMTESGEWVPSWDSTQVERSGQLPIAILIDLIMLPEGTDWEEERDEESRGRFTRQLNLRNRPLDLPAMILAKQEADALNAGGGVGLGGRARDTDEEGLDLDGDGIPDLSASGDADWDTPAAPGSVAECVRSNWPKCVDQFGTANCNQWSTLTQVNTEGFGIHQSWCQ